MRAARSFMPVRNQNWYDLNESRPFPVDDTATGLSDAGLRLPSGLIADLILKVPKTLGERAWLGAVTNTPHLVAITIMSCDDYFAVSSFTPMATLYVRKPIVPRRPYTLEAQYPGVGGWITFGDEILDNMWWGKFSSPSQSLLHPSTVRAYQELPIPSVSSRGNATPLTGIVRLEGGNDIEIVKECREIPGYAPDVLHQCEPTNGKLREVIVFRLRSERPDTAGLGARGYNVFEKYAGLCGNRPESENCGDPAPIESIAGVLPDCCGNITLNFSGCAIVSEIAEAVEFDYMGDPVAVTSYCGFVLDCGLGLSDACVTQDRLPLPDGTLPNEYDDLCESVTVISVSVPPDPGPDPGEPTYPEESASAAADPGLPFETTFPDSSVEPLFSIQEGHMLWYAPGQYGALGGDSMSLRNIAAVNSVYSPHFRRVTGQFQMLDGPLSDIWQPPSGASILHNAAMVMDWRATIAEANRFQYWLAELDWDGTYFGQQSFRIAFFDGTNYTTFLAVMLPEPILLNKTYEISFSAWPNYTLPGRSWLSATLKEVGGLTLAGIGPMSVSGYGDVPSAMFGMSTNRAATAWSYFSLDNV